MQPPHSPTDARSEFPDEVWKAGGLKPGVAAEVARKTGVPEAHVFGTSSFFHLLADPDTKVRVCTGLSCQLAGSHELLDLAQRSGLPAKGCSCLAACDAPPAVLRDRWVLTEVTPSDVKAADGTGPSWSPPTRPTGRANAAGEAPLDPRPPRSSPWPWTSWASLTFQGPPTTGPRS